VASIAPPLLPLAPRVPTSASDAEYRAPPIG
jgi:hypothetical protein